MFDYMSFTDSKCVQILAPQDTAAVFPANYLLGERLGNVSREVAAVLADLMDIKNLLLDECNVYDVGFKFVCELVEDTNHKREGFLIRILVYSLNSDLWTKKMFDILKTKKIKALKLIEN